MAGFNYQFIGRMSCVAAVVGTRGDIRIVITYPELLRHHVGAGERHLLVPDLWVQEPIAWDNGMVKLVENTLALAKDHFQEQGMTFHDDGDPHHRERQPVDCAG